MTYVAKTKKQLRGESGSLLKKIASELGLIDDEIDTIEALADGKIIVGNGLGVATDVAMSGDATIANTGAVAIAAAHMKVATGALASGNANAYAFAWQNPEAAKILVHRVLVDVTTAGGTGSSVIDVGSAAGATTHSGNLIDGADLNAVALYDNIDDQGTSGKSKQKLDEKDGTTDHITGQILVADAASLAGKYYIIYTEVAT